jgi:hypothetical protein
MNAAHRREAGTESNGSDEYKTAELPKVDTFGMLGFFYFERYTFRI